MVTIVQERPNTTTFNNHRYHIGRQIGNTSLLRLRNITAHLPDNIEIYAKAEWENPSGSVKDRAAYNIIRQAEINGQLTPGKTILDSTSGNTGIAFAMIGAALGYPVKLFMSAGVTPERIDILQQYDGIDLEFTDPAESSDGAIRAVQELVVLEPNRYFFADQYNNPANWQAHYNSTAVEIWRQTAGRITHFIAGLGTSGTFVGTSRRLREYDDRLETISLQPASPIHGIEGLKHMPSAIRPGIYDDTVADRNLGIRTEDTFAMARRVKEWEGLELGISSAAALVGALRVAEELAARGEAGVIVTIFPDDASKYLSQALWQKS